MNLYHTEILYVGMPDNITTDVYAHTVREALAGAMSIYPDIDVLMAACCLQERDVTIIRGGVDVVHADCFPA